MSVRHNGIIISNTNIIDGIKIHGTDVAVDTNKIVDLSVLEQFDVLPVASADNTGRVVQYVGLTNQSYTHGYVYECVALGTEPETYEWQQRNVQPEPLPEGGSDFTLGQNLEYIEASTESFDYFDYMIPDGTAAFWTNQYYQKNSVIEIDFEPIYGEDNANKSIVFITATAGTFSNAGWGVKYNSTGESLILQFYNVSDTKRYPEEFNRFKIDCIKKGIYRDGVGEILAGSDAQVASSYNIMLFANNDHGAIKDFSKVKLRSFKHWKGGILSSWLVPAYKKVTREYGLLDIVNCEVSFRSFTAATYHGTASPKILSTMDSVMTNIAGNSESIIESKVASTTKLGYAGDTIIGSGATKAYDTDSTTAYGYHATAGSGVAVGSSAQTGLGVAVGSGASTPTDSINSKCIAIGNSAVVTSNYGIAIGNNITVSNGIAIGNVSSSATDSITLAVGSMTSHSQIGSVCIGRNAIAWDYGVTIGYNGTNQNGNNSIVIGSSALSQGGSNIAIGDSARADLNNTGNPIAYGIAIGFNAVTKRHGAIQIGQGTNEEDGTLNIGLYSGKTGTSNNYKLLDFEGVIPYGRLSLTAPADKQALTYDAETDTVKWSTVEGGGGEPYTLPTATQQRLGGIKVGNGLSVKTDGTLSVDASATGGYGISYDGGFAESVYLISQTVDGGSADTKYTPAQVIDGGRANL